MHCSLTEETHVQSKRHRPPPRKPAESGDSTTLTLDQLWDRLPAKQQHLILQSLTRMIQRTPPIRKEVNDD